MVSQDALESRQLESAKEQFCLWGLALTPSDPEVAFPLLQCPQEPSLGRTHHLLCRPQSLFSSLCYLNYFQRLLSSSPRLL